MTSDGGIGKCGWRSALCRADDLECLGPETGVGGLYCSGGHTHAGFDANRLGCERSGLLGIAAGFFVAALLFLLVYRRQLIQGGLPTGDLIYSDVSEQEAQVLVSQRHGLKGKRTARTV